MHGVTIFFFCIHLSILFLLHIHITELFLSVLLADFDDVVFLLECIVLSDCN